MANVNLHFSHADTMDRTMSVLPFSIAETKLSSASRIIYLVSFISGGTETPITVPLQTIVNPNFSVHIR